MKKRILALVMALAMCLSLLPVTALAAEEQVDFAFSRMVLGNALDMQFAFPKAGVEAGAYVRVVKTAADGSEKVQTIPQTAFKAATIDGEAHYYVTYTGIAAKEMADTITATVYNADGTAISTAWEDSVRSYAMRALAAEGIADADKAMYVDMLNYGAAAQTYFGYNADDLANKELSAEQKALATKADACVDLSVKGAYNVGSRLILENSIKVQQAFADLNSGMHAVLTYVDHNGKNVRDIIYGSEFKLGEIDIIELDQLVLADARVPYTVTVKNPDGSVYDTHTDSVASYIARASEDALYDAIMNFADGAYAYFHNEELPDDGDDGDDNVTDAVSGSAVVEVTEDGQVKQNVFIEVADSDVQATVPAGVAVEDGKTELTLTVSSKNESDSDVTVGADEAASSYDVHIDGVAANNEQAIIVDLGIILAPGLNMGNISLYHVENGVTNAMTQVDPIAELDEHNEFYYDAATGAVTVAMATFSEVMVIADLESKWEGVIATGFARGTGTENDPYLIANADQLAYMSKAVSEENETYGDKHYKLVTDVNFGGYENYCTIVDGKEVIDKTKVFYPIGFWAEQEGNNKAGETWYDHGGNFSGVFDGNGNVVSGICQRTWDMDGNYDNGYWDAAMGLFGAVYDGTVKNLTVKDFQSDGEFTPTGCVATYAGGNSTFENITLVNCNPRVYNTGNGGIVGLNYNSTSGGEDHLVFKNITIDQTNKISALWGSWDVSCGGIIGRLRENSKHTTEQKNTVHFENCHVAAQIDVYNDVCANYQYYQYRYSGMMAGTVDYITDVDHLDVEDVMTAENCTVTYGDWNEYWYCELVKNSRASYTRDHQFSRLTKIESKSEIWDGEKWTQEGNFVIPGDKMTDTAECFHIFRKSDNTLYRHFHDVADETNPVIREEANVGYEGPDIDKDGVADLKEDRQHYYLPFGQLFTGYGWGSTPYDASEFENIDIEVTEDNSNLKATKKFGYTGKSYVATGSTVEVGDFFQGLVSASYISQSTVQVFVSPIGEESTVSATYSANAIDWTKGTLNFTGVGVAKVVITDYFYCTPTVIEIEVCDANEFGVIELTNVETYKAVSVNGMNIRFPAPIALGVNGDPYSYRAVLYANSDYTGMIGQVTANSSTVAYGKGDVMQMTLRNDNIDTVVGDFNNTTDFGKLPNGTYYLYVTMTVDGVFYEGVAPIRWSGFVTGENDIDLSNAVLAESVENIDRMNITFPIPVELTKNTVFGYEVVLYAGGDYSGKIGYVANGAAVAAKDYVEGDDFMRTVLGSYADTTVSEFDGKDYGKLPNGTYYLYVEMTIGNTTYQGWSPVEWTGYVETVDQSTTTLTQNTEFAERMNLTFPIPAEMVKGEHYEYQLGLYTNSDYKTGKVGNGVSADTTAVTKDYTAGDAMSLVIVAKEADTSTDRDANTLPNGTYYLDMSVIIDGVTYRTRGPIKWRGYEEKPAEKTVDVVSVQALGTSTMRVMVVCPEKVNSGEVLVTNLTVTDKASGTVIAQRAVDRPARTNAAGANMGLAVDIENPIWSAAATVSGTIEIDGTEYTISGETDLGYAYNLSAIRPHEKTMVITVVSPVTATGVTVTSRVTDQATGTVLAERTRALDEKEIVAGEYWGVQTTLLTGYTGGTAVAEVSFTVDATGETYTTRSVLELDAYTYPPVTTTLDIANGVYDIHSSGTKYDLGFANNKTMLCFKVVVPEGVDWETCQIGNNASAGVEFIYHIWAGNSIIMTNTVRGRAITADSSGCYQFAMTAEGNLKDGYTLENLSGRTDMGIEISIYDGENTYYAKETGLTMDYYTNPNA